MFDISNQIAYDGLMVFGAPDRPAFGGRDVWCHITISAAITIPADDPVD
jgi:hypothetical protein